ncbi:phosphatase [Prochlorococcus sp. RSP50]|nr:phosphatase [Prochlorococcus sp. RS50]AQL33145.1 phosphatase [Prochlorococcus sp. RS01]AQL35012.1 phosphatase [Prochlorococcus sp. RS04]
MTSGDFFYSEEGKLLKVFGPDDHDALTLLKPYIDIRFITGDKKGFKISQKRIVEDMKFKLDLVSTVKRIDWIKDNYNCNDVIYMGDGIFDHYVMREVRYSIAPSNGDPFTKKSANFVTKRSGGDRSVAEACLHILEKFFKPYNPKNFPHNKVKFSGEWAI